MISPMENNSITKSKILADVKYEIRGQLARRAAELEKRGYEIVSLNIGNPGLFGFRTPDTMRLAMIENLGQAEPYSHQKGIFPAREAVVMQQQDRGILNVTAEEVFIAALLRYVGEITFWCVSGEEGEQIIELIEQRGFSEEMAQQEVLGFTLDQLTVGLT